MSTQADARTLHRIEQLVVRVLERAIRGVQHQFGCVGGSLVALGFGLHTKVVELTIERVVGNGSAHVSVVQNQRRVVRADVLQQDDPILARCLGVGRNRRMDTAKRERCRTAMKRKLQLLRVLVHTVVRVDFPDVLDDTLRYRRQIYVIGNLIRLERMIPEPLCLKYLGDDTRVGVLQHREGVDATEFTQV